MKYIVHIGPHGKGGMTSVINNIFKSNLNNKYKLLMLITQYDHLNPIQTIKTYIKLKKLLAKKEVDLVHIHMASNGSYFRKVFFIKLCDRYNVPIIIHVHGAYFKEFYEELNTNEKEKMKVNFRKCSAIIGLTRDWKDFLTDLINAEEKVYIINNFVEIPTTFSKPNNEIANVSFLGRIGERKGTFDLLNAIELLNKNSNLQFRVNIAGDGEIEKCKKYIKDKELENVKYLGWINEEERNRLLQKTDILILPSYYESFGMVLIEAMSYKIPVIGGNAGSIPNVITNNFDGLLVEPGNVTDIADKLEYLICNPKIRVKMGQNGYKSVCEKYSSKYFSQRLDELYKKLIGVNKNEQ